MRAANWDNDYYLDARKGLRVFSRVNLAIIDLSIASARPGAPTAAIQLIIDDLVDAAKTLAQIEINLAIASDGNARHQSALTQMEKAAEDAENGKPVNAVAHYRNAWYKAVTALKHVMLFPQPSAVTLPLAKIGHMVKR